MQGQAISQVFRPEPPTAGGSELELTLGSTLQPAAAQQIGGLAKLLYTVAETRVLLSLSKTVVYEQLNAGRLRSVHQGRTRLIPAAAILEYVALLEREAAADSPAGGPVDERGQDAGSSAPAWSVGSGGGGLPHMDTFLRVHLWRSTGCHDQPWGL